MSFADSYDSLIVELDNATGVATVTLNRPEKRNALNALMVDELSDALAWADADERVRVVMLRGEGKDFCAGVDLQMLMDMIDAGVEEQVADADALGDLFLIIRRIGLPVIAAVHGHALAGGCGLATACDIVLASEDARFGYPEVKIGFVPAMVMTMLRRAVGEKRALELALTGRTVTAEEAERYGLVQQLYPAKAFDEMSRAYVVELAERSSSALTLLKRLFYESELYSFEASVRAGAEINALARQTEGYREGVSKFLKSRAAKER